METQKTETQQTETQKTETQVGFREKLTGYRQWMEGSRADGQRGTELRPGNQGQDPDGPGGPGQPADALGKDRRVHRDHERRRTPRLCVHQRRAGQCSVQHPWEQSPCSSYPSC